MPTSPRLPRPLLVSSCTDITVHAMPFFVGLAFPFGSTQPAYSTCLYRPRLSPTHTHTHTHTPPPPHTHTRPPPPTHHAHPPAHAHTHTHTHTPHTYRLFAITLQ